MQPTVSTAPQPPARRLALIGHGRIGGIVARAVRQGDCEGWDLAAVLTRRASGSGDPRWHIDPDRFFAAPADLYLECAGPAVLAALGARALEHADVWSVSGVALADDALRAQLQAVGARHGHRLRLVAGAAGGYDALQALAQAPSLQVQVDIVAAEHGQPLDCSAREAARLFPDGVNLAVAAALAGAGLDATRVRAHRDPDPAHRLLGIRAQSALGRLETRLEPVTDPARDLHIVAASLLAALRQAGQVIWVG